MVLLRSAPHQWSIKPNLRPSISSQITAKAGNMENNHRVDTVVYKKGLRTALQRGTVPRYLRAIENVRDMGGGETKRTEHFVEWHDGDVNKLMKGQSYAQVCLYRDLGKVCCIQPSVCYPVCHPKSGFVEGIELLHRLLLYLVIRNHCSKLRHIRIPLLPIVIQELATHGHTPHC